MPLVTDSRAISLMEADDIVRAAALEMNLSVGTVRMWTGIGEIEGYGETWQGVGQPAEITALSQGITGTTGQMQLTLGGVADPSVAAADRTWGELVDLALEEMQPDVYQGRLSRVFEIVSVPGERRSLGNAVFVPLLSMEMDTVEEVAGGGVRGLRLTLRPAGADRDSPIAAYFTPSDHSAEHPDDTAFDRQPSVGQEPIRLGRYPINGNAASNVSVVRGFLS